MSQAPGEVPPRIEQDVGLGAAVPCYAAVDLLRGRERVRITLDGQAYLLRLTANGRLFLTK